MVKEKTPAEAGVMTPMGFELSTGSSRNSRLSRSGGAKSGAGSRNAPETGVETRQTRRGLDVGDWLEACPEGLPAAVMAGIEAMVKAAGKR